MKRLSILLISLTVLLMSCASPTVAQTPIVSDTKLEIVSELAISPVVDVDYTRQLVATLPNAKWRIVSGFFPTGSIRLSSSGLFAGVATKHGERGSFMIEVSKGSQTVTREFTYVVGDVVWASPDVVNVGNFRPGGRAEYNIKVHNDDSIVSDQKKVVTDNTDVPGSDGLVTVPIPLNQLLHNADLANVNFVKSNNPLEHLKAISYDAAKHTLNVSGFLPLTERLIIVNYIADAAFSVAYETVDLNVENWVTISDTSFTLPPHTTKEILVAIEMPQNAKIDVKDFRFRILTGRGVTAKGNVVLAAVNAVTWVVRMR